MKISHSLQQKLYILFWNKFDNNNNPPKFIIENKNNGGDRVKTPANFGCTLFVCADCGCDKSLKFVIHKFYVLVVP